MNASDQTQNKQSQKSVTVRVELSDFLSKLTPENNFDISIPAGCTVAEFVEYLVVRLGGDFRRALLDNDGRPHAEYAIVLNQQIIAPRRLTEFTIRDNSKLSIIPIVGGG
jgi:sulfur carrier protein ThiS